MKLGIPPKSTPNNPPAPVNPKSSSAGASDELNLNLLSSQASPSSANLEPIDLAARLNLSNPAEPPPISPPPTIPSLPAVPTLIEPAELMRLLRDPESGRLMVEIAGQRYTRLADISDKKVGQYILQLVGQLLAFTNGMYAAEAGIKSTPAPKAGNTPLPLAAPDTSPLPAALAPTTPVAPQPVSPPAPKIEQAYPVSPPALALTPEPEPAQRRGLFGRSKPAKAPLLAPLNLADQINQIVQINLSRSPLAATTKLEILSDPAGGIQIKVNGQIYHSPDDIPDLEVRTLIKDSIKQWEKS